MRQSLGVKDAIAPVLRVPRRVYPKRDRPDSDDDCDCQKNDCDEHGGLFRCSVFVLIDGQRSQAANRAIKDALLLHEKWPDRVCEVARPDQRGAFQGGPSPRCSGGNESRLTR
jgi:hypothetical protein